MIRETPRLKNLVKDEYLRQRLEPRPGDRYYIHLADLRAAIERVRNREPLRILDYGCGGSPYRTLFAASAYHRADLKDVPDIDIAFDDDSRIPTVATGSYDLVLSTQVLEHVREPAAYLAEAHRVLAPGGRLILTTHGTFPDHACPYDYYRWTADGLALAVSRAGFRVTGAYKLSTGPRALVFLISEHHSELLAPGWSLRSVWLRLFRAPFRWWLPGIERFCDRVFARHQIVPAAQPGSSALYVGTMIEAVRD